MKKNNKAKAKDKQGAFFAFTADEKAVVVDLLFEDMRLAAKRQQLETELRQYQIRRNEFFKRFAARIGLNPGQLDATTLTKEGIKAK